MNHQQKQPLPKVFEYISLDAWTSRSSWNPSFIFRLPWLGIAAFLGPLASAASSIDILETSNGKPTSEWSIQPTVYLAISSTITNLILYLALAEGVNLAWRRRAMKDNMKIAGLLIRASETASRQLSLLKDVVIWLL